MKKTAAVIISFVVACLLLVCLGVWPLTKSIRNNAQKLRDGKATFSSLENKINSLEYFKTSYKILSGDIARANSLFVNRDMPVEFIQATEKAAADSGAVISISPQSTGNIKGDVWPSMRFKLSVAGSSTACLKFLARLETAPYLLQIQNLSLKKLTNEEKANNEQRGLPTGEIVGEIVIKAFTR